jgi:hypothetical protein
LVAVVKRPFPTDAPKAQSIDVDVGCVGLGEDYVRHVHPRVSISVQLEIGDERGCPCGSQFRRRVKNRSALAPVRFNIFCSMWYASTEVFQVWVS